MDFEVFLYKLKFEQLEKKGRADVFLDFQPQAALL